MKRYAIFNTPPVGQDVQVTGSAHHEKFRNLLGWEDYQTFYVFKDEFPLEHFDVYLITGSPVGVYDSFSWIEKLSSFIRDNKTSKFVGVCFGHQLLANALGGKAEKSLKGWGLGARETNIIHQKPWMNPPVETLKLHYSHQDQVTKLPPGAQKLAGDDFCEFSIFEHSGRYLGIQGHPEFCCEDMRKLIDSKAELACLDTRQRAHDSLCGELPSARIIASWINNFIDM